MSEFANPLEEDALLQYQTPNNTFFVTTTPETVHRHLRHIVKIAIEYEDLGPDIVDEYGGFHSYFNYITKVPLEEFDDILKKSPSESFGKVMASSYIALPSYLRSIRDRVMHDYTKILVNESNYRILKAYRDGDDSLAIVILDLFEEEGIMFCNKLLKIDI
jgi:hypothetical protein